MGQADVGHRAGRPRAGASLVLMGMPLLAMLLLGGPAAPVAAAEGEGCAAAAWPLTEDGARLNDAPAPMANGGTLVLGAPTAVLLDLMPPAEARLPFPPERSPAADTFAGYVTLQPPPAGGVLQVTVAQAAWIDLIRDGEALKPLAFTGVRACPLARKSVRFQVPAHAGPWVLQLSGASTRRLGVAVSVVP